MVPAAWPSRHAPEANVAGAICVCGCVCGCACAPNRFIGCDAGAGALVPKPNPPKLPAAPKAGALLAPNNDGAEAPSCCPPKSEGPDDAGCAPKSDGAEAGCAPNRDGAEAGCAPNKEEDDEAG